MTDDEIIASGRLVFPNGGEIYVDSLYDGQVCYRLWRPGEDEANWLRTSIDHFVMLVRKEGGARRSSDAG
jgi:hypothetical protein